MGLYRSRLSLGTLEQIFRRQNWRYELSDEVLVTAFSRITMLFAVDEEREILTMFVPVVPGKGMSGYVPVQPEAERDVCVFLMAVNYLLALGTYTRDSTDGQITYQVNVPLSGSVLSDEMLNQIIDITIATYEHRYQMINALLAHRTSLQDALNEINRGRGTPSAMAV